MNRNINGAIPRGRVRRKKRRISPLSKLAIVALAIGCIAMMRAFALPIFEEVNAQPTWTLMPVDAEQTMYTTVTEEAPEPLRPYEPDVPYTSMTIPDNSALTWEQSDDWRLKLVNPNHSLPADFVPPLSTLPNGLQFDSRAIDQLNLMLTDMRSQGLSPVVASAYRSIARQTELFNNRVAHYQRTGFTQEEAEQETARSIARPGTSEHNLGLAVDIVDISYQMLTNNQAYTPVGLWLRENSAYYGFILRYDRDTEHITGFMYEPWHFRYVGIEAATFMFENDVVLEEYVYWRIKNYDF